MGRRVVETRKATKVTGLEKCSKLRLLTLNGCGRHTREGFRTRPKLQRLELSDNGLSDGLESLSDACLVQLKSLSLAGNRFSTLETIESLVPSRRPRSRRAPSASARRPRRHPTRAAARSR